MDTSNFKEVFESPKVKELTAQLAALELEVARLRKDAERLNFIQSNCRCDPMMDGQHKWWPTNFNKCLNGPSIRAAIDAAMIAGDKNVLD